MKPECIRCREDFPVSDRWQDVKSTPSDTIYLSYSMGKLTPIRITDEVTIYLCGNCFFDLTDENEN